MSDVYVAGSLRHTSREWWKIYEKIADVVKEFGFNVHVPHIDTIKAVNGRVEDIHNPDLDISMRTEVYKKNFEVIKNCKLFVAEITQRSTGTGIEIGFALQMGKPIICLAHKDADVTSMVLGPANLGKINFIRYGTEEDALSQLKTVLENNFRNLIE